MLNGSPLIAVDERDVLGILCRVNSSHSKHVEKTVAEVPRLFEVSCAVFTSRSKKALYGSHNYFRPKLEYGCQVWHNGC